MGGSNSLPDGVYYHHWLLGWINLVLANLYGFCLKNFGNAYIYALCSLNEYLQIPSLPQELDFGGYVLDHLRTMMYLWSSNSEEEAEEPLLINIALNACLRRPMGSMLDSDITKLKQHVKEFVTNNAKSFESVILQKIYAQYSFYRKAEDMLQWAREEKKLYRERHPYRIASQVQEACALMLLNDLEEASTAVEVIRDDIDSMLLETEVSRGSYSEVPFCFSADRAYVHGMLTGIYLHMSNSAAKEGKTGDANFYAGLTKQEDAMLAEQVEQKMKPTNAVFAEWDGELW